MDGYEEISGGPSRGRPGRRRSPGPAGAVRWAGAHRGRITVALCTAVALVAAGTATWQRTHPPSPQTQLLVQVDPSEYLLPGRFDTNGQAAVLLLLRLTAGDGLAGSVRLLGLSGGGIASTDTRQLTAPGQARFAVRATVSCDQWADGKGVLAEFRLPASGGHAVVHVPLDAGAASPVHAEISGPCSRFAAAHPLRLDAFAATVDPTEPTAHTTWTVTNRSSSAVVLPGLQDVAALGGAPLRMLDALGPTTIAAGGRAVLERDLAVTSCLDPGALDRRGVGARLTGSGSPSAQLPGGVATVDLPGDDTAALMAQATLACLGAPTLAGARATIRLVLPPAGTPAPALGGSPGRALLAVSAQLNATGVPEPVPVVGSGGPWTVAVASPDWYIGPLAGRPFAALTVRAAGPGPLRLSGSWALTTCDQAFHLSGRATPTITVLLVAARVYPYLLATPTSGPTACGASGIRG